MGNLYILKISKMDGLQSNTMINKEKWGGLCPFPPPPPKCRLCLGTYQDVKWCKSSGHTIKQVESVLTSATTPVVKTGRVTMSSVWIYILQIPILLKSKSVLTDVLLLVLLFTINKPITHVKIHVMLIWEDEA